MSGAAKLDEENPGLGEHPVDIGGFRVLEFLGHGGMGSVYQVENPAGGPPLALKLLRGSANLRQLDRLRFEREFRIISQMDHPALLKVYQLGEFEGRPFFTMDYLAGETLRPYVANALWPERLRRIRDSFATLLSGLEYIHQHQVVHRDLKPENLIIDSEGRAHLLDFGLARGAANWGSDSQAKRLTEPGMVIGTVHYMSPEQITGSELDTRTDLYSLGVMLYEALTGKLPFDGAEPMTVLFQILNQPPPPFRPLGPTHPALEELLLRLLSKEPHERPQRAREVLENWSELFDSVPLDHSLEVSVSAVRRSLPSGSPRLYAAQLVGRERHLETLQAGLTTLRSRPWLALLAGSTGLGKSRLIQALSNAARACQIDVLTCPAFEATPIPYQLWLKAMRWASSEAAHPELQPFRRALSTVIPEAYSEQQLPQVDEAHPGNDPVQRYHLFEGMARLLCRRIRTRPALLVVEDIHWADVASLEFLLYFIQTRWTEESEPLPVGLLISWREEESQSNKELNALRRVFNDLGGQRIVLEPLQEQETAQMLHSMLGGPMHKEAVTKIYQETEGNPLFISELTRTLVGEGRLLPVDGVFVLDSTALAQTSLGGSRIPTTMREAILRRLVGLSKEAVDILRLCAVLGSKIDFELLAATTGLADRHLLEIVYQLVQRKLLVERREFVFPNQSTIDIVLETTSFEELRDLHRRVAQGLEKLFRRPTSLAGGAVSPDRIRQLAHFCQLSGDFPRAAQQLLIAARQASQAYAFEDAARLLEQLLGLPESCYPEAAWRIQEMWADAVYCAGQTEDALEKYIWMVDLVSDSQDAIDEPELRPRLLRKVGTCWERCGHMQKAHEVLREALALLDVQLSEGSQGTGVRKALGVLSRNLFKNLQSAGEWRAREVYWVCERLMRVLYVIRPKAWIQDYLNLILIQFKVAWALRGKEKSGSSQPVAQALLLGGYFSLRGLRWTSVAQSTLVLAAQSAEEMADGPSKANLIRDVGYVLLLSGSPQRARTLLEKAYAISHRIGDQHGMAVNHLQLGSLAAYLGSLDKALEEAEKALQAARRTGSHAEQTMAIADLAALQATRGLLPEAREYLRVAEDMRARCRATYIDLLFGRAHCYVAFHEGQLETAQQLADHLFSRHNELGELPYHLVSFGILSLSAQVKRLRKGGSFDKAAFKEKLTLLRKMSKGYGVYLKVLDRVEAESFFYQGKRSRALEQLAGCAYWADRENHPLEAARTHLCLAQMLEEEGLGQHHRRQAAQEFLRAGVVNVNE